MTTAALGGAALGFTLADAVADAFAAVAVADALAAAFAAAAAAADADAFADAARTLAEAFADAARTLADTFADAARTPTGAGAALAVMLALSDDVIGCACTALDAPQGAPGVTLPSDRGARASSALAAAAPRSSIVCLARSFHRCCMTS